MKIIKVKRCLRCPYFWDTFSFQCGYNGREIKDPYKEDLPEWCPLEDWKEEDNG